MSRFTRRGLFLVAGAVALAGCQSGSASSTGGAAAADGKLRIAVIPKGTTHEFWMAVHAGAEKAGKELGVEII